MSRRSSAFCTARISGCIARPNPTPMTTMGMNVCQMGVATPSRVNSAMPAAMTSVPATGNHLYRPNRLISCPDTIEVKMMPTIIGSISRPDAVGVSPLTICRYRGT